MALILSDQFKKDILKLKKEGKALPSKVMELIISIDDNPSKPLEGIGKPEALKNNLAGFYSRRITDKHRLIYTIKEGNVLLVSCYGHYTDK